MTVIAVGLRGAAHRAGAQAPGVEVDFIQAVAGQRNATDFGVIGDGVHDDTAALQYAIDYCKERSLALFIPTGRYKITDTLKCGYGGTDAYATVVIRGEKRSRLGYQDNNDAAQGTYIDATAITDRPAINFQGNGFSHISSMEVLMGNITAAAFLDQEPSPDKADYRSNDIRDDRYSPAACIAINAYGGDAPPGGGYSNDVYGRANGGYVQIEDMYLHGSECCVVVNPAGNAAGLGNTILIQHCYFEGAVYGVSLCDSNGRNVIINDVDMGLIHTGVTNNTHGAQGGFPPRVYGGEWNTMFRWLDMSAAVAAMHFSGVDGEAVCSIGRWGNSGAGGNPLTIEGCTAYMQTNEHREMVHMACHSPVRITGCTLATERGSFNTIGTHSPDVDNSSFLAQPFYAAAWGHDYYLCQGYPNFSGEPQADNVTLVVPNLANHNPNNPSLSSFRRVGPSNVRPRLEFTRSSQFMTIGTVLYRVAFPNDELNVPGVLATSWVVGASTVTCVATTVAEWQVGDVLAWLPATAGANVGASAQVRYVPALIVTGIAGSDVTMTMMYAPSEYDGTYSGDAFMLQDMWAPDPGVAFTATWTTGSTTIATNRDPRLVLRNGDWVTSAAGLAARSRVVSMTVNSIVLNKLPTSNRTDEPLYWAKLEAV